MAGGGLPMDKIVDRLARNARKQREFRHLVRGKHLPYSMLKRIADIYFLYHYAGLRQSQLARIFKVSRTRIKQIINKDRGLNFTVCHPRRSCL
jgi:hypothetical protein